MKLFELYIRHTQCPQCSKPITYYDDEAACEKCGVTFKPDNHLELQDAPRNPPYVGFGKRFNIPASIKEPNTTAPRGRIISHMN